MPNTRIKVTSEWTLYFNGSEHMKCAKYFDVMDEFFRLRHEYPNATLRLDKQDISREIWCNNGRDLEE